MIRFLGETTVVPFDVIVAIPTSLILHSARIDLNKTNSAFNHTTRDEALFGEVGTLLVTNTIQIVNVFFFFVNRDRLARRFPRSL